MQSKTPYFAPDASNELSIYFNTLPKNIQETIIQSHSPISTLDELKSVANKLMGK